MAFLIALTVPAHPAEAVTVTATNNATVQPGGPRTGTNGLRFLNVEGSGAGAFASFGVFDFSLAAGGADTVSGLSLSLTEANATFTAPGSLRFFVVGDSSASIAAGVSALTFETAAAALPAGLGSQLGSAYALGTGTFTTNGNVNNGQVDTYSFGLIGAAQTLVSGLASGGGVLRLVVAPDDAAVAATFQGHTNTAPPTLNLQISAVPEPASGLSLLAGLAVLGLAARRRQS